MEDGPKLTCYPNVRYYPNPVDPPSPTSNARSYMKNSERTGGQTVYSFTGITQG